jgi:hypothetical protein
VSRDPQAYPTIRKEKQKNSVCKIEIAASNWERKATVQSHEGIAFKGTVQQDGSGRN